MSIHNFHHKTALKLVRENDIIYHEDLQIANMVKNRRLAKSISDAAWGTFLAILSFKAAYAMLVGKWSQCLRSIPAKTVATSSMGSIVANGSRNP